jgi:hypothetical protein
LAATYSSDATYTFSGQSMSNSGRGIAVNSADTRLFETVYSGTSGTVVYLDTGTGAPVGSVTPASPTKISDIAISPDDSTLYFARYNGVDWEVDAVPATDGDHTTTTTKDITTVVPAVGSTATGISIVKSDTTVYLAVVTNTVLQIYTSVSGAAFSKTAETALGSTTIARDVAAVNTGSDVRFYVLNPSYTPGSSLSVYSTTGALIATTWSDLPSSFLGYNIDSVTAAGTVDGVPSLYLGADSADAYGDAVLTVFRYTYAGVWANDGFGYGFSTTSPLQDLQPLDTTPTLVPAAIAANHVYLGCALPDGSGGVNDETVRVVVTPTTNLPATLNGVVDEVPPAAEQQHSLGANVVLRGLDTPVATTDSNGAYTLASITPGSVTLGFSQYGYASSSTTVTVGSGETKTLSTVVLSTVVPSFTLGYAFAPPITDGLVVQDEYKDPQMPFYVLGGNSLPDSSIQTTAYAMYDADNLYVAVVGLEPSITLNRAAYSNQNMLTQDDNVQIYLDPPHRHDVKGIATNLYQFALNIPPVISGFDPSPPMTFQRRINADGTGADAIPSSDWYARVKYFTGGWMLEARISLSSFAPFAPPTPTSVWGLLVARHRPSAHYDFLPVDYSTSNAPSARLTDSTMWTDVKFETPVTNVKGDVNLNGVLDAADVVDVLKMAAGLSFGTRDSSDPDPDPQLTIRNSILAKGDVWPVAAGDGKITLEDAVRLARAMTGLSPIN